MTCVFYIYVMKIYFIFQAVRLESTYQNRTRYMVVVSTNGRQDTEESIVLGMDFSSNDRYLDTDVDKKVCFENIPFGKKETFKERSLRRRG